jgi:hypothetical protein
MFSQTDPPGPPARLRSALAARLGVDVRALAAFRIGLGAVLLVDLLLRARHLRAFYTDAGVLPRSALYASYPVVGRLSLHAVSGSARVQAALFAAAAVAAAALLVGYRTRLATLASLLLLASLHARNPLVLQGGDALLRRLLFWGLLLPLGARWSVDARRSIDPDAAARGSRGVIAGVGTAALLAQVVLVYAATAALKLRGGTWGTGVAVRQVFALDQYTVLLGDALAGHPALLVALGHAWLALLVASPLAVGLRGRARTAAVAAFAAGHVGTALTLKLGVFPLVSLTALVPVLPAAVWDGVERRAAAAIRAATRVGDRLAAAAPAARPGGWRRPLADGRLRSAGVGGLLAALLVWNAATVGAVSGGTTADLPVDPTEHRWDMFAPNPPTDDGWVVAPARTTGGRRVDAFGGGPAPGRSTRPPDVSATYPSARWLVYVRGLQAGAEPRLRGAFGDYLCRRWAARHGTALAGGTAVYVEERTRLDRPDPVRRVELASFTCRADGTVPGVSRVSRGPRRSQSAAPPA